MSLAIANDPVPLRMDEDGAIRVGGTRVTLDTILGLYHSGQPAEEIAHQFPTVALADIHATIAYYLRHQADVDDYLAEGLKEAEEVRKYWDSRLDRDAIRQRMADRNAVQQGADASTPRG